MFPGEPCRSTGTMYPEEPCIRYNRAFTRTMHPVEPCSNENHKLQENDASRRTVHPAENYASWRTMYTESPGIK